MTGVLAMGLKKTSLYLDISQADHWDKPGVAYRQ